MHSVTFIHHLFHPCLQGTLWFSSDPESAFHRTKVVVTYVQSVYDTVGVLYNALVEVAILLIPIWNSGVLYVVQPAVFTSIEVLTLAFAGRPYSGILSEETLHFEGHFCPEDGSTGAAARWCGLASAYSNQLGYTDQGDAFVSNDTLALSASTARRLSLETGEPLLASLDLTFLTDAIQAIVASAITILGVSSDVFFHVAYEILSVAFKVLFDAAVMIIKSLASAVLAIVNSGTFAQILKWGVDLILIIVLDIALPYLFALLDAFFCLFDLAQPAGWEPQLKCVAATCFQEGSDVAADTFHLFSSIPIVAERVETVFEKLVNTFTGQRYGSTPSAQVNAPDLGDSSKGTPAAQACAACFTCRVPELRLVWLGASLLLGCVIDGVRYEGEVSNHCLTDGSYYTETLCGPRTLAARALNNDQWAERYEGHLDFDAKKLQQLASDFESLAEDLGGKAGSDIGNAAAVAAEAWFKRDTESPTQAAPFVRHVCNIMRDTNPDNDEGPYYAFLHKKDSLGYYASKGVYEMCKRHTAMNYCQIGAGKTAVDGAYEIFACAKSQPQCLRDRAVCLGQCSGNEAETLLRSDFISGFSKQELGHLSQQQLLLGRANVTLRSEIVKVHLFDMGAAMRDFMASTRVRGGGTAINEIQCAANPEACAAINHVLRNAPTLMFVNGKFVHRYTAGVAEPPSPPSPPPRLLQYFDSPSPPPPPPPTPPPWTQGAEMCVPVITPEEAGIIDTLDADETQRALCLYVRGLRDERIDARRCFKTPSPSPPPPPPQPEALRSLIDTFLQHARIKGGGTADAEPEPIPGSMQFYAKEQVEQRQGVVAFIDKLAETNFKLRDALSGMRKKIYDEDALNGRRLFESSARSFDLADNALRIDALGGAPLLGLTRSECSTLCTAMRNESEPVQCKGFAARMLDPSDLTDLSVASCWLLKSLGSCREIDWAVSVYTRRDTNPCDLPTEHDNPCAACHQPLFDWQVFLHCVLYATGYVSH